MGKITMEMLKEALNLLLNDSSLYLSRVFRGRALKLIEELEKKS